MPLRSPLALFLAVSLLPIGAWAAQPLLEFSGSAQALRFALPDALYTTGLRADFRHLQVIDAEQEEIPFAICEQHREEQRQARLPLIAVPDIARLVLGTDQNWRLELPSGARMPEQAQEWVIDARRAEWPLAAIDVLATVKEVRSSPNLRQWSGALRFEQGPEGIRLEPPKRASFFRLILRQAEARKDTQDTILTTLRDSDFLRVPHWFQPAAQPDTDESSQRFSHDRRLPVFAARLPNSDPQQTWSLESRQGDWDAWKPRGQISSGHADRTLRFSAVTDPQWRVSGSEAPLQLAHAAYELRLPNGQPGATYRLLRHPEARYGPSRSCSATRPLEEQAPTTLKLLDLSSATPENQPPSNLRPLFLAILLLGLSVLGLWRYRMKSRER